MIEIKELDSLLSPALGENKVITSYKTKNLIAAGENYGSIMLALDVKIKNHKNEKEEEINLVAKMCPPGEFIRKLFNTPVTFKKEVGFYRSIIPTMQNFQKERGCEVTYNFFPKYFGSRISLNPFSNTVDDDACLVLENLKISGFRTEDRLRGFNLKTAKYIIRDLATFHAVPIALKIEKPEVFKKNVQPFLVPHIEEETFSDEMVKSIQTNLMEIINRNKECAKYSDRVLTLIKRGEVSFKNSKIIHGKEPFMTVMHNDFWVNNTMLKFDQDGNPISNAIVDFQLTIYGNPAHDLLFFIYSSLSHDLILENYKKLVDLYYDNFIDVLKNLKVDTTPFSYEAFLKEIERAATSYQCYHILFMLKPIFTDKEKVKELNDVNENELSSGDNVSELYYPKLWGTILDFADKNWL